MNGYKILKCSREEQRVSGELPCSATGLTLFSFSFYLHICFTFCLFFLRYFLKKHGILFTNIARDEFECMFSFVSLLVISLL